MGMMRIEFRGGAKFGIASGSHTIVTDQPLADGGEDAGMSPVELFVGSLTSCVAYFVGRYCKRHQIPHDGVTVEAEWTMAEQPHRVGSVSMRIALPALLTPDQRERLLKVAHGCTVHQSLAVPPTVKIDLDEKAGVHGIAGA